MGYSKVNRLIDVLKQTWISKLASGEDREETPRFTAADIKDVVYQEEHNVPSIIFTLKDDTQGLVYTNELNMKELEALAYWAENLGVARKWISPR